MFDNSKRWIVELCNDLAGSIDIYQIIVGKFLAIKLFK